MNTQDALRYVENLRNGLYGLDKLADVLTACAQAESKMYVAEEKAAAAEARIAALEVEAEKLEAVVAQRDAAQKKFEVLEQRNNELSQAIDAYYAKIAAL